MDCDHLNLLDSFFGIVPSGRRLQFAIENDGHHYFGAIYIYCIYIYMFHDDCRAIVQELDGF